MTAVIKSYVDPDGIPYERIEGNFWDILHELNRHLTNGYVVHSNHRMHHGPIGMYFVSVHQKNPRVVEDVAQKTTLPDVGPYTKEQMEEMPISELQRRCKQEYGLTDRSKAALIKKVLKHYEGGSND